MMKKIVLLICLSCLMLCFSFLGVKADVCIYNSKKVAENVLQLLKKVDHVVYYCPTCVGNNKAYKISLNSVEVKDGDDSQERLVYLNGKQVDIAYIYLLTEKLGIYQNLGTMVQCADFSNTEIREFLNIDKPYGIEAVNELRKRLGKCSGFMPDLSEVKDVNVFQIANEKSVDEYRKCVYEVLEGALLQFYPNKVEEIKKSFNDVAMEMDKYHSYLEEENYSREYIIKLKTNALLEYIVDNLLNEVGVEYGED